MHTVISNNKRKARMLSMSKDNVVKFPKKEKRSKVDKQFVTLEHQANVIEEQRKRIAKILEEHGY
ncbi:MAG: hypothetical protein P8N24_01660 [Hellea sp.]|nr:hypothetical protein [Hellea sp.]